MCIPTNMGGRDGERISLKDGGIAGERGGKRGARGSAERDGNFVGLPDIAKRVDSLSVELVCTPCQLLVIDIWADCHFSRMNFKNACMGGFVGEGGGEV